MTLSKVYTNIAKIIYPTLTAVNIMTQYKKKKRKKNTCLFGIMIIIHLETEMKRKKITLILIFPDKILKLIFYTQYP